MESVAFVASAIAVVPNVPLIGQVLAEDLDAQVERDAGQEGSANRLGGDHRRHVRDKGLVVRQDRIRGQSAAVKGDFIQHPDPPFIHRARTRRSQLG